MGKRSKIITKCPHCNTLASFKPLFNPFIFLLLFIPFVIPGTIYWLATDNKVRCTKCGKTSKIHSATRSILAITGSTAVMPKCTYCDYEGPFMHDFSWWEVFFWSIFFIIPGIIYYITHRKRYVCPRCHETPDMWV